MPTMATAQLNRPTFAPRPQIRLEASLQRLSDDATRAARASREAELQANSATTTLNELNEQHVEYHSADALTAIGHAKFAAAITAAFILDAFLASPASEYILLQYLRMSDAGAALLRYLLPAAILVAEMGIAALRVDPEVGVAGRTGLNTLAAGLLIGMPLLVGETVLQDGGGLLSGKFTLLAGAMMLLCLCVHALILFSGEAQARTLGYYQYRRRAGRLGREITQHRTIAPRQAQLAADRFAAWVAHRDALIRQYPRATVPQPHWGRETIAVINAEFGYNAIQPFAGQAPPQTPGNNDGPPPPAPGTGADDLRDAHDRRVRVSESEVTAD